MKILNKRITDLINALMSDKGDCRTAPATPGMLIIIAKNSAHKIQEKE